MESKVVIHNPVVRPRTGAMYRFVGRNGESFIHGDAVVVAYDHYNADIHGLARMTVADGISLMKQLIVRLVKSPDREVILKLLRDL